MPADPILLHASCVAFAGRGVLILGPSGSGKSGLALGLIALGAGLVADDAVLIAPEGEGVRAARPPGLPRRRAEHAVIV
ncbi:MAG: HPr kinase/phosphorylase, partial [Gemmobacter sp.]